MRAENALGKASGLEQREAQQHRIAHARPDSGDDVRIRGNALNQHGIDAHADHDEKGLKA